MYGNFEDSGVSGVSLKIIVVSLMILKALFESLPE